jgi:hypothetical protein
MAGHDEKGFTLSPPAAAAALPNAVPVYLITHQIRPGTITRAGHLARAPGVSP